ncbi:unnamed protein product [Prorocentrum cordatum]|uniref:Uncharacterized protein n=1 Tax=Prorocentrum cordatum TaxID=2364126 RepID=A0ABN9PJ57_9DINO|nr:unnamed protein product [Polarella glacialis]
MVAFGSTANAKAASPEGLVQLSGQKAPKGKQQRASKGKLSADECAELRRLARSAKGGESEALEHLKSHGIDLEVLGIGQDPCQIALNAGDMADVKNTSEEKTTTTEADECSSGGDDCTSTKCCSRPGAQCYEKTPDYAKCRVECVPGKDLTDVDSTPWSCKELGDRTPGEEKCSDVGDNCMETRCCSDVGFACYAKNKTFATCRAGACVPGPDYTDEDGWEPWTCEQLSEPTPGGKAAWVENECAGDEDDCREAACCRTTRYQCYEMGEGWAQCKADCSTEPDPERSWEDPWTCQELGPRTPESAADVGTGPRGGQVASWVRDRCSKDAEDCTESQCCTEVGAQCFAKDKTYAKCMLSCNSSAPDTDGWSCEAKGSPSFGIARKSWPSLFCFSVIHVCPDEKKCYENALMNRIYELGPDSAGIFGCDDWNVFANEPAKVGGRDATQIKGNISVGISKDGTAANTELFMAVWELVIDDGRFRMHDWTVKMDPDAVLLPWKLGDRLAPHTNNGEHDGRLFVVNCNAWPGSDSFPMMYGSVEIFSKGAMTAYAANMPAAQTTSSGRTGARTTSSPDPAAAGAWTSWTWAAWTCSTWSATTSAWARARAAPATAARARGRPSTPSRTSRSGRTATTTPSGTTRPLPRPPPRRGPGAAGGRRGLAAAGLAGAAGLEETRRP